MNKYKVLKTITERSIKYEEGSLIELTEQRAKQLEGFVELYEQGRLQEKQFKKKLKNKVITKINDKNL